MMKRSELFFSFILIPLDALALLFAFILSYHLRNSLIPVQTLKTVTSQINAFYTPGNYVEPFATYLHYLGYIIPAMIVIFAFVGLYSIRSATPWTKRVLHVLIGVSVGEFFILLLFLLKKDFFIPRLTVLYSWVLCTVFVILIRYLVREIQKLLYRYNIGVIRVAVIGKSEIANQIMHSLSSRLNPTYRLVRRFDSIDVGDITKQINKDNFDELIVGSEHYHNEDLVILRNHCLEHHIGFSFVPALFSALQSSYAIRSEVGLPMIEVQPTPLEGWGRLVKRIFDILGSLFFIILLSPVFLLISLWLLFASPGPLIYKHQRIGKNKAPIVVWKFRSMYIEYCTGDKYDGDDAFAELLRANPELAKEWEDTHKLKNDPRVSAPGRFLRATSLDELPQLFNVLTGQLSLVGPRPIVEDEVSKYGETARILFTVKPGLTGLWQVSGRSDLSYDERIALDAKYIETWNLWSDIVILFKTAGVVLRGSKRGSY